MKKIKLFEEFISSKVLNEATEDISNEIGIKPNAGLAKKVLKLAIQQADNKWQNSYTVEISKGKKVTFDTDVALHAMVGSQQRGKDGEWIREVDGIKFRIDAEDGVIQAFWSKFKSKTPGADEKRHDSDEIKVNFKTAKLTAIMGIISKFAAMPDPHKKKGKTAEDKEIKALRNELLSGAIDLAGAAKSFDKPELEDELFSIEKELEDKDNDFTMDDLEEIKLRMDELEQEINI